MSAATTGKHGGGRKRDESGGVRIGATNGGTIVMTGTTVAATVEIPRDGRENHRPVTPSSPTPTPSERAAPRPLLLPRAAAETEQHLKHEFRKLGGSRASVPMMAPAVGSEIERLERHAATLRRLRETLLGESNGSFTTKV